MNNKFLLNFCLLCIGFSYTILMKNRIAFGIILGVGLILLFFFFKKKFLDELKLGLKSLKKLDLFVLLLVSTSAIISSFYSIRIERSIPVLIYLFLFMFLATIVYLILRKENNVKKNLFQLLSISIFFNSIFIFIFNISNYEFGVTAEVIRFKGYMNILTLLIIVIFYLNKSWINYISLLTLVPNLLMSNCNAALLGLLIGLVTYIFYYVSNKFMKPKIIVIVFTLISLFLSINLIKNLPKNFDKIAIDNFEFVIPTKLIDAHRQFIWGFSIKKFYHKPFFGYGQDTSNFIKGGQKVIGSEFTGDMTFIPSHPHNFFIELLLDIGFVGLVLFLILILLINIKIWRLNNSISLKFFLIFFNAYFWGSSLVNFSFWLGWWQGSYYLLLSLIASQAYNKKLYSNE